MKLVQFSPALLLGTAAAASGRAAVFDFANAPESVPTASVHDTVMYLADKFGISDYYRLGAASSVDFLSRMHGRDSGKPHMMVVVQGVDEPATLFDGASFEVSLGANTAASLVNSMVREFPEHVAHELNVLHVAAVSDELAVVTLADAGRRLHHEYKLFRQALPLQWNRMVNVDGEHPAFADAGLRLVNDRLYISEVMQMVKLAAESGHLFVAARLDSLASVGAKTGFSSRTYGVAKAAMARSIEALRDQFDVTVLALPPLYRVAADGERMAKRSRELEDVFAQVSARGAVAAKACFASEDACEASTNSCSGHGACAKVQAKCWQCACTATYDKKAAKTTRWAGADCSKKDIAAQAHLLLWTSVALVVALVGGVKLLFSIGTEALPGVLEAATVKRST